MCLLPFFAGTEEWGRVGRGASKKGALILFYFVLGVGQVLKLGQYIYIQLTTYFVQHNLTQGDVFLYIWKPDR